MSEEKKRVAVYFRNGLKAVFNDEKLIFRSGDDVPKQCIGDYQGLIMVNWANVCFARLVEEEVHNDAE